MVLSTWNLLYMDKCVPKPFVNISNQTKLKLKHNNDKKKQNRNVKIEVVKFPHVFYVSTTQWPHNVIYFLFLNDGYIQILSSYILDIFFYKYVSWNQDEISVFFLL